MAFNITDFNNKWANFKEELMSYFNKRVLDKNGDTMVGSLVLARDPESDMEAGTKKYIDSLIKKSTEFAPGALRDVNFGWTTDIQTGYIYYPLGTNSNVPLNTTCVFDAKSYYSSLANGTVLLKCILPQVSLRASYYDNGWKNASVDAVISIKTTANDVVLVNEKECEVVISSGSIVSAPKNTDSIFNKAKNISTEIPVSAGEPITIKTEICVHSHTFQASNHYISYQNSSLNVGEILAGVANPIADTSIIHRI